MHYNGQEGRGCCMSSGEEFGHVNEGLHLDSKGAHTLGQDASDAIWQRMPFSIPLGAPDTRFNLFVHTMYKRSDA